MIIHSSDSRGFADHGWLKSRHSFSFADYYDPARMGFGALRVLNDDTVAAGMGFGTHPHREMEIITIPSEGALQHRDSEGNSSIIRKGDVQIMSAGTGISHSEFNASQSEPVKLLQIWVMPAIHGVTPRYEQKNFSHIDKKNKFITVISNDGQDGSIIINQNAFFSLAEIEEGSEVIYNKKSPENVFYVFVLSGQVMIRGAIFRPRDGIGISDMDSLRISGLTPSEILLMEVPIL
jgi:redox-sensitive bicupin YhaK (pirin superfamily)